jgi:hypothetical protein
MTRRNMGEDVCWAVANSYDADEPHFVLRRVSSSSMQKFKNCFDAQQKGERASRRSGVVVSYVDIQAVRKHNVRAGRN